MGNPVISCQVARSIAKHLDLERNTLPRYGLTARQALFVQEYLIDLNATQAALRAGYSPNTARTIASENLTKPHIMKAITAKTKAKAERCEITQDFVLGILRREANAGDMAEPNNARIRAAELLGKHIGMFVDRSEVTMLDTPEKQDATVDDVNDFLAEMRQ